MRKALVALFLAAAFPAFGDGPTMSYQTTPADLSRWWNTNVEVVITAEGASQISCDGVTATSTTSELAFSVEQEGTTDLRCTATDASGGSAVLSVPSIKIDKTPPFINFQTCCTPPNENGWMREALAQALASDTLSGLATGAVAARLFREEGANVSWGPAPFYDQAGNCSQLIVGDGAPAAGCTGVFHPGMKLDRTPPVVTFTPLRPPNEAGWYNSRPVQFTAVDNVSGMFDPGPYPNVYSPPSGSFQFPDGANQTETLSFKDLAGNATTSSFTASVDASPPILTITRTPQPNVNGWNNTDATLSISAADGLSGMVSASVNGNPVSYDSFTHTSTTDGVTTFFYRAVDAAGNVASTTQSVRVDRTPPEIKFSISPVANANGWHRTPVTIRVFGIDATSGMLDLPQDRPINTEGTNMFTGNGLVRDLAGNSTAAELPRLNIDMTPPVITASRAPLANANGWNNTDVTAHFEASDARSGVEGPATLDLTFTESRGNQGAQWFVDDKAGNRSHQEIFNINIDKNAPVVSTFAFPFANAAGWNNSDVRVDFSATDETFSGPASRSVTVTQEGRDLTASQVFTDLAGNSTTATRRGINIDKTPPRFTATRAPLANPFGWNNTNVTVHFEGADDLSGLAGPASDDIVLTTDGANQTVQQSFSNAFTDLAGNRTMAALGGISIDRTPPSVICFATPEFLWPPSHQMIPVTMGVFFDDGDEYTPRSGGPANGIPLLSLVSSNPKSGDTAGWDVGTQDTEGSLLAWRAKDPPVYTFMYGASDLAGNASTCTAQVRVDAGRGRSVR